MEARKGKPLKRCAEIGYQHCLTKSHTEYFLYQIFIFRSDCSTWLCASKGECMLSSLCAAEYNWICIVHYKFATAFATDDDNIQNRFKMDCVMSYYVVKDRRSFSACARFFCDDGRCSPKVLGLKHLRFFFFLTSSSMSGRFGDLSPEQVRPSRIMSLVLLSVVIFDFCFCFCFSASCFG